MVGAAIIELIMASSVACMAALKAWVSSLFGYESATVNSNSSVALEFAVENATKISPEPSLLTAPNRPSASDGRFAKRVN